MRQFGGRVNNPTTSLGDLNSTFTIQGDPTLPRLTVTGYFTGADDRSPGPDAGSDYCRRARTRSASATGNHSFKLGGDVSYEKIVHDTLLDNYGVFTFNGSKTGNAYADFLLGLPATMTQDAPHPEDRTTARTSALFAQDDFRVHPRADAEPRASATTCSSRYTDPQDRKLAYVPGQQSRCRPTAPEGLLFPVTTASAAASSRPTVNNIAPRLGVAWDPERRRAHGGPRRLRHVLRQHHRQRVEHDGRQPAVHRAPVVPDGLHAVRSVPQPAWRRRPVPVPLRRRRSPRFTLPAQVFGPSLDFVWPLHVPDQPDRSSGRSAAALQRERVVRRARSAQPRRQRRPATTPCYAPAATAANVNARRPYQPGAIGSAARPGVRSSRPTTTACS